MGRWSRICLRMAQLRTQAEQRPPAPGVFLSPRSQTRSRTARIQARPRNTGARQPGTPGREVVAVRGGLWGLRIQRFESQVPRFPPSLFHGFRGICPIYIFLPLSTPQTPALPPSLPYWNGEAECQVQGSSGLQGLSEPPKRGRPIAGRQTLGGPGRGGWRRMQRGVTQEPPRQ